MEHKITVDEAFAPYKTPKHLAELEVDRNIALQQLGQFYNDGMVTRAYVIDQAEMLCDDMKELTDYLVTLNIDLNEE